MTRIHIIGPNHSLNKGWAAMVISTVDALRKLIPNVEFSIDSFLPDIDREVYEGVEVLETILASKLRATNLLVRCIIYAMLHKFFGFKASSLIDKRELWRYRRADLVIDLGGDPLTQPFQITKLSLLLKKNTVYMIAHCYQLLYGIILGKPTVLYAHSVGPLGPLKFLVKPILNKMSLITLRDRVSEQYLKRIGVTKPPIYVTADTAFLLQLPPKERIDEIFLRKNVKGKPLVGICLSQEGANYYFRGGRGRFIDLMGQVVNGLIEKFDMTILLLAHSTGLNPLMNDFLLSQEIYDRIKNKDRVRLFGSEYSSGELKGIINRCDLFVGMRMHSNISALSSSIPTLAIAHSWKTYGILQMLGQERWICDIRMLTYEKLMLMVEDIWHNREGIRKNLKLKINDVMRLALLNAELVGKLLERKNFS